MPVEVGVLDASGGGRAGWPVEVGELCPQHVPGPQTLKPSPPGRRGRRRRWPSRIGSPTWPSSPKTLPPPTHTGRRRRRRLRPSRSASSPWLAHVAWVVRGAPLMTWTSRWRSYWRLSRLRGEGGGGMPREAGLWPWGRGCVLSALPGHVVHLVSGSVVHMVLGHIVHLVSGSVVHVVLGHVVHMVSGSVVHIILGHVVHLVSGSVVHVLGHVVHLVSGSVVHMVLGHVVHLVSGSAVQMASESSGGDVLCPLSASAKSKRPCVFAYHP